MSVAVDPAVAADLGVAGSLLGGGPPAERPAAADPEVARFQLFDSVATLLRNIGRERPTVVVLDDLHAADTASIRFLRFLANQMNDTTLGTRIT